MSVVIISKAYACVAPIAVYAMVGLWVLITYHWFRSFFSHKHCIVIPLQGISITLSLQCSFF